LQFGAICGKLPAGQPQDERMSSKPNGIPPSKVLIADDNPQILELLEAYLEPLSVQVSLAADGEATLAAVERHPPDLILLDIMMPKRSGFEVCRLLKDDPRYRDIPIVMITALNEVGDWERARECGADDFLSKPVNKIELLARVQNLLKLRHLKRSLNRRGPEPKAEK
jgi:two-component system cell cycle response regulator